MTASGPRQAHHPRRPGPYKPHPHRYTGQGPSANDPRPSSAPCVRLPNLRQGPVTLREDVVDDSEHRAPTSAPSHPLALDLLLTPRCLFVGEGFEHQLAPSGRRVHRQMGMTSAESHTRPDRTMPGAVPVA